MYQLTIKLSAEDSPAIQLHNIEAGQTLLEVCLANNIPLPHDCGGIASCTTCAVQVMKGSEFLEPASRREQHILVKKNKTGAQLRLACQSMLLDGSGEIMIEAFIKATDDE